MDYDDQPNDLGRAKLQFKRNLRDSWHDLCDVLGIPPYERDRFAAGNQAAAIWEWLEQRGGLDRLRSALIQIERADLAAGLPPSLSGVEDAPRARRGPLFAAVAIVGLVLIGLTVFVLNALPGGTVPDTDPTPSPSVKCGLTHAEESHDELYKTYRYTIRNCGDKTVKRKLDIAAFNDADCHTIKPKATITAKVTIPVWASIRDIKEC